MGSNFPSGVNGKGNGKHAAMSGEKWKGFKGAAKVHMGRGVGFTPGVNRLECNSPESPGEVPKALLPLGAGALGSKEGAGMVPSVAPCA